MSPPGTSGASSSAGLVRLVAAREISTRVRDRNFILSSVVIILVLVGVLVFQVLLSRGDDDSRVGVVAGSTELTSALTAQAETVGLDLTVVPLDDAAAATRAVREDDVDAALIDGTGENPRLVVAEPDGTLEAVVGSAVTGLAVDEQLARAGVEVTVPELEVAPLDPDDGRDQRVAVAVIGVGMLYGLLILFGQFVAQGVVEEKSSRVVELLLATLRPWQLLAGKILGLGLLGLAQIVVVSVVGVIGALAFDLVDVPGDLIGTVVSVVLWFVVGYAFYASVFAVAASLVSRQEDLGSVLMPTTLLLVAGFVVGLQAAGSPGGTLAVVTSFVPGLSPLVMPVRIAAGEVTAWEVGLSAVLMLATIAVVVRLGGRVYAGALLRTGGRIRAREALRAERA